MRLPSCILFGLAGAGLLAGLSSCEHVKPSSLAQTRTSFEFYTEADKASEPVRQADVSALHTGTIYSPSRPMLPLAKPEYPAIPLAERSAWVSVGVHLTISPEGRVSDVGPSPVCITTPNPHADAYRTAVESAVRQWRFFPAEERHMVKVTGSDGSTWWRASHIDKIESSVDVTFTFMSSGRVLPEVIGAKS